MPRSAWGIRQRIYIGCGPPVGWLGRMSEATPENRPPEWRFAAMIAAVGILAGILLWLLTTVVSRANVSGDGWSLAGNGALIVPFGLGPAVVAGGWTAVILRM